MNNKTAKKIKRKVFIAYYGIPIATGSRIWPPRYEIKNALKRKTFKAMVRSAKKNYMGAGFNITDQSEVKLNAHSRRFKTSHIPKQEIKTTI